MPLMMTEFNAGLGLPFGRDLDAAYAAAFVVHNHAALQGVENFEVLSYWSYSDLFEEQGMDSTPYCKAIAARGHRRDAVRGVEVRRHHVHSCIVRVAVGQEVLDGQRAKVGPAHVAAEPCRRRAAHLDLLVHGLDGARRGVAHGAPLVRGAVEEAAIGLVVELESPEIAGRA